MRTNAKTHCISARGFQLWNGCSDYMRKCQTVGKFKEKLKEDIIKRYKASLHVVSLIFYFLCAE